MSIEMLLEKRWTGPGVFNMEEFDPDPFMADLMEFGLPWQVADCDQPID